jgi:hypothetical protein
MGRSYSEYPFHEQQPMLGVQGSGPRLGNDEDTQKVAQQKKKGGATTARATKTSASPARQARKATAAKKSTPATPLAKGKPAGKVRAAKKAATKRVH